MATLDWQQWFARWEAMQNCYVPHRLHRFDLMLRLPNLPSEGELRILDLGCGLGSVAFHALRRYPHAQIVAVDWNQVLLTMGQQMAETKGNGRVQFAQADIRQADWWAAYDGVFDLVLSANALHWLNATHLAEIYRHIYRALKPGGWFLNSDHVSSDDPETQARYRQLLQAQQRAALSTANADDWDSFWQALSREMGQNDLLAQHDEAEIWEGSEDGQPRQFHLDTLQACGFQRIEFHWQEMGEAIIGARKTSQIRTVTENSAEKVVAYITNQERLLVFRHTQHPEAGLQVPGGTIEADESPELAVQRKAQEQTGLDGLKIQACLGMEDVDLSSIGHGIQRHHFFHLTSEGEMPETWRRYEAALSDGNSAPTEFEFFWAKLPDGVPLLLAGGQRAQPYLLPCPNETAIIKMAVRSARESKTAPTATLENPIAIGRTAEVYAWGENQILKLFRDWVPAVNAEYEALLARAVYAAGLPVPAVGEVVKINGRLGIIYERVEEFSMAAILTVKPWLLFQYAHLLAELHVGLHTKSMTQDFPSQRQRLEIKLQEAILPSDLRKAALRALARLPDSNQLCHGDFHMNNVLMAQRGPVVIDWVDATRGNPLADVARSSILQSSAAASGPLVYRIANRWFHTAYLKRYFKLCPGGWQEFACWRPIVAAARLSENIPGTEKQLLAQARVLLTKPDDQ